MNEKEPPTPAHPADGTPCQHSSPGFGQRCWPPTQPLFPLKPSTVIFTTRAVFPGTEERIKGNTLLGRKIHVGRLQLQSSFF